MPPFSGKHHGVEDELREQIAELRDEVSALARTLSRRGANTYEGSREIAGELYDRMARRFHDAVPMLRRRAGVIEQSAHDNPALAAAVGLAVIGLVISFFAVRRQIPDISPFEE